MVIIITSLNPQRVRPASRWLREEEEEEEEGGGTFCAPDERRNHASKTRGRDHSNIHPL